MKSTLTEESPGDAPVSAAVAPDEIARFLKRPESFGDGTSTVEFKETHISWVALTDRRVYKVKKPVRFPFLDYSTLERRLNACREELRLNARLAPGVYLGYLPITRRADGALQFGGDGHAMEYCVVMKRLPGARMLDRLIEERQASVADIEHLLDVLIPFYAKAARGPEIDEFATAVAIEKQARENLATIDASEHGLPPPMFQRVRASQLQFLKLQNEILGDRVRCGRVCEGHGDLRPEHVCLDSPPVVFDCVEFSLPLRAADLASELAFLAMECDFLGAAELAAALIDGYRNRSGDEVPDNLMHFYKSYRACIRAKVELLRADQLAGSQAAADRTERSGRGEGNRTARGGEISSSPERADAALRPSQRARRYLQLASFYATEFYRPKLFIMVGATGTGKSSVAHALGDAFGLEVLRTDAIRHELAGQRMPDAEYGQGIYSDATTARTYETLFARAEPLLRDAVPVVLDGTFRDARQRDRAVELAQRYGTDAHFIYCRCPPGIARARIADRIARREGISDARPELFAVQERELQEAADWADRSVVVLDTTLPISTSVAETIDALRQPTVHRIR